MTPFTYPPTRRHDVIEVLHGTPVTDPYRWLEDDHAPETAAWVQAQNEITFAALDAIPERAALRERLTALWDYEKFGVPFRRGGRIFFTRNDGLRNQAILYWAASLEEEPTILLDPNTLREDGTAALSTYAVSDDGEYLAYGISQAGSDWQEIHVRRVSTGQDLPDRVQWVKFCEPAWVPSGAGFYYSRYDPPAGGEDLKGANYYQKLCFHPLASSADADPVVYERPDQKEWGFQGQVTDDGAYLVITVWKGTHEENGLFYQDLRDPAAPVVELLEDFDASYTFLGSEGSRFWVLTNLDAPLRRVIAIDLAAPDRDAWQTVVPEDADALEWAAMAGGALFCGYLRDAHSRVRVTTLTGEPRGEVVLPGLGTAAGFMGRRADPEVFYHYSSFSTPGDVYRLRIDTLASERVFHPRLPFDPEQFVTEQVFYTSKDGMRVPMFLTHARGLARDGQNRAYLYGYGGFNIAITPGFNPAMIAWMEMGGVWAVANLRGGGEYGQAWHEGGMKANKQNVFDDFIAAAEYLIAAGYTRTPKLAIHGGSNGGLLTAACLTQRPDLFGAVVVSVGVLDMLRFHKFTIGWAWVSDYGSPDDAGDFRALRAYSPYHNIKAGVAYPPTLITTGDHDDRVFPAHSFKFAAALQRAQAGPAPILIRVDVRAGHGQGKPTGKLIEERADILAFLLKYLA